MSVRRSATGEGALNPTERLMPCPARRRPQPSSSGDRVSHQPPPAVADQTGPATWSSVAALLLRWPRLPPRPPAPRQLQAASCQKPGKSSCPEPVRQNGLLLPATDRG